MASSNKSLDSSNRTIPSGKGRKFGIVVADYYKDITDALLKGAKVCLIEHGVKEADVYVSDVPGAFELPLGAMKLFEQNSLDGVIALGCVIKGETDHDVYINNSVAQGLTTLSLKTGKPFVFGLLTPNNMDQALARSGGDMGNKGIEAAHTLLRMSALINGRKHKIGF